MKNELTIFDQIQDKELRPWLPENKPDEKFASKISGLKTIPPVTQFRYEIDFYRPFNSKTKYYYKLLLNEVVKYCNHVIPMILNTDDFREQKYLLNDTLDKKLKTRLKAIGVLIKEHQFDTSYIDPKNPSFDIDTDHKTDTYIIQLLKTCYIAIFLEIQEVFIEMREDVMILDDFNRQLLFDPITVETFIKKIQPLIKIEIEAEPQEVLTSTSKPADVNLLSFTYKKYLTNSDNLTNLHDNLRKNKFIVKETTLVNFKKVFSGKEITVPIVWTGNISDLNYFIKVIHNKNKSVIDLKQHQWEVACKCFVQENGQPFDRKKLKQQKKPKSTFIQLEKAAEFL